LKLARVFYPKVTTRKSRVISSLKKNYPQDPFTIFLEFQFLRWIDELVLFRDQVAHISSINRNLEVRAAFISRCNVTTDVTKKPMEAFLKIKSGRFKTKIIPIYLPLSPDRKFKIDELLEANKLNYDEDFVLFEKYLDTVNYKP